MPKIKTNVTKKLQIVHTETKKYKYIRYMETKTNKPENVQGTEMVNTKKQVDLSNYELEGVTIRLSERKLLLKMEMVEEFNKNEKLWEKFKELVEKTKETQPQVTILYTMVKMGM